MHQPIKLIIMKRKKLLTSIASAACIILTCSFLPTHESSNNPSGKSMFIAATTYTEDPIDLSRDGVSPALGDTFIVFASKYLYLNGTSIVNQSFTLTQPAITYLSTLASGMSGGSTTNYVLGLQFEYGVSSSNPNLLDLYVRPLWLTRSAQSGSQVGTNTYSYYATTQSLAGSYYLILPSGSVQPESMNPIAQDVIDANTYQNTIEISHPQSYPTPPTMPDFNNTSDITGDIHTLVYPFQELNAVMSLNICTQVEILNIALPVTNPATKIIYYKHDLLIGPPGLQDSLHLTANEFADLANMCPPQCPPPSTQNAYEVTFTLLH